MNPGPPSKETTGHGLWGSFRHSLLSTSKRKHLLLSFSVEWFNFLVRVLPGFVERILDITGVGLMLPFKTLFAMLFMFVISQQMSLTLCEKGTRTAASHSEVTVARARIIHRTFAFTVA